MNFRFNKSYIEDLEIVLNKKHAKILGENNFMKAVYLKNGELEIRSCSSFDQNDTPKRCNLAFYPYSFDMLAYTSGENEWNTELMKIIGDATFYSIKRLSKRYFTIDDVSLGTVISKLTLNKGFNGNENGYENIIMKCVCNSNTLEIHNKELCNNTTIDGNDPNLSKVYAIDDNANDIEYTVDEKDKWDKCIEELSNLYEERSRKPEENKQNIIITNDEFLI